MSTSFTVVLFVILIGQNISAQSPENFGLIYDAMSRPLESVFSGIPPQPAAIEEFLKSRPIETVSHLDRSICEESNEHYWSAIAHRILNWFLPQKVHASNCPGGQCSGSYMTYTQRPCGHGCSTYPRHYYADSQTAPYYRGYQYVGGLTYCESVCAEMGCNNP